jgi:hypothetical protein
MKAVTLLLAILATTGMAGAQEVLNCSFAPGWQQTGPKRQYTSDNLWDYKDGAAEGYLGYGFVRMQGIDCKSGADTMSIDVSQMTDADAAYGMFTANRDPGQPIAKIGMGAQVLSQSALMAKGVYFVEIAQVTSNTSTDNSAVLRALATRIADLLKGQTTTPETLAWFPKEDLFSAGMIPESVLGLRQLKRGYVAKYRQGQAFILHESSPEAAAAILKQVRQRFPDSIDAKVADEAFQVNAKYLGGLCIFRKGSYIAGYANQPAPAASVTKSLALATRIP